MDNIYLIKDFINNGLKVEFLDIIYLVSILFGIFTIVSVNPIVSVLFLIGLFVNISVLLILIGYNFIGLSYILVYVGAVSILFLFILMLINIRISEIISETNNYIPLAILTVILFYYIIGQILPLNLIDQNILTYLYCIQQINYAMNTTYYNRLMLFQNLKKILMEQHNLFQNRVV